MEDLIKREYAIQALNDCIDIKGYAYTSLHNSLLQIPSEEFVPELLNKGEIKEYENGMITMSRETFNEYHNIAVNDSIRRGLWEKLP